jgi:hypothetical protein
MYIWIIGILLLYLVVKYRIIQGIIVFCFGYIPFVWQLREGVRERRLQSLKKKYLRNKLKNEMYVQNKKVDKGIH